MIKIIHLVIYISIFSLVQNVFAQEEFTSDELFVQARNTAFEKDNYPEARQICKKILLKSPDYHDVSVFLGRLYTWDHLRDSARAVFNGILAKDSTFYDAYTAFIDLEYWADNYNTALIVADNALKYYPASEEVLMKKARILSAEKEYDKAFNTLEKLFTINNTYSDAILFYERLKEEVRINSITITSDYDSFDGNLSPWRAASISYSRRTNIGSIIGRINYANRFDADGWQYEMDAYPRFADGFYSYINAGYSTFSIFPKYRLGLSLYYSLPFSFEIESGIRYLAFSSSNIKIYTASLGKYYSNYWFSFRMYITPSVARASYSYSLISRYYLSGADDYLSLSLGTGISPDDRANNGSNLLISKKISGEYQFKIARQFILNVTAGFYREEFSAEKFRNRTSLGFGFKTIF